MSDGKTKILFLINNLNPGGAEHVLIDLLRHLSQEKYEIELKLINNTGIHIDKVPNIGIIQIYGCLAWLVQLILLRVCSFRRFFSFEFLFFILFFSICVGNVVNIWAAMMVFATLKYFYAQAERLNNNTAFA